MRFYFTILICLVVKSLTLAQTIEPFFEQGYGIKNKLTGKILISPKYARIVDYNDSLIIVQSDNFRYAVVDTLDRIKISFSSEKLFFEKYNTEHLGEICEETTTFNFIATRYYIDKARNCIPYDYCLCPKSKQLTDSVAQYLKLVQKGYEYFDDNKKDSALIFIDKAIEANPTNVYVYSTRANLSMMNTKWQLIKNVDSLGANNLHTIINDLDKAYKLKTTPLNYLRILSQKRQVFRYYIKDKALVDSIDEESKKYNPQIVNQGLLLNTGISYSNGIEMELGLSFGLFSRNEKAWKTPYVTNSLLFIGCSYLKNISQKYDGYKFYLFSFVKPINVSICPILFTNYKKMDWVLRPEIGYGYKSFSFSLGYNLFVDKATYKELNTFNLNIRYYLPLNNDILYTIR